jgi:hypothetical protein
MRQCEAIERNDLPCGDRVFGTDRNTNVGYCKNHQFKRTDIKKPQFNHSGMKKHPQLRGNTKQKEIVHPVKRFTPDQVKLLDNLFSKAVRQKSADDMGIVKCYTCGYPDHWKYQECGHFMSRRNQSTRWNFDNARPQCFNCNHSLDGNHEIFKINLIQEIGIERVEEVERLSRRRNELSFEEIKSTIL